MAKGGAKKIIVGLGNPGKEYESTYHNAGFLMLSFVVSMLAKGEGGAKLQAWKKYKGIFEYIEAGRIVFVRPLTYMNDSGKAVREALKKFGAKPEDLTVIHDDSDLKIGSHKISFARSSAGQKGVQSIIDALKTNEFTRIRIGIRPQQEVRRKKAGEFALKQITAKDKKILQEIFQLLYINVTENE